MQLIKKTSNLLTIVLNLLTMNLNFNKFKQKKNLLYLFLCDYFIIQIKVFEKYSCTKKSIKP